MEELSKKKEKAKNGNIFTRRKFLFLSSLAAFVAAFLPKISVGKLFNAGKICETTTTDIQGPFYLSGAPNTSILAALTEPGERLFITGTVYRSDCITPIENAVVDVWHANDAGDYDNSNLYNLRGIINTNINGEYGFESILPGQYDIGGGQFRPSHIHFKASAQDHSSLTTQVYFEGDPFIASDPWASDLAAVNRIIPLTQDINSAWTGVFDIVLDSTVGIENIETEADLGYLLQNYPNPISASTIIRFGVFTRSNVILDVFDLNGRFVKNLIHQTMTPGRYTTDWDGTDQTGVNVPNGVYICKFILNDLNLKNIRMVVQK